MIETIFNAFLECKRLICTDTRNIIPGSIFFALKGENFDGNLYVNEALNKGALYCVTDNAAYKSDKTFLVKNVTETLQQLANIYRKRNSFKIIAITGTNGKTTTKELILSVLSAKFRCAATKGNLNNHLGVPLTILGTSPETEILIVEMGANHMNEINQLCSIAEPDFGIITNIGKAHLEGFGSFGNVIQAKSELYQFLIQNNRIIFVNANDKLLCDLVNDYEHLVYYGNKDSGCFAQKIHFDKKLFIEVHIQNKTHKISTQLFGRYNIDNVLAALCIGQHFNVNVAESVKQIEKYTPQNNRSQIKSTSSNTLILDSYNANPTSMEAALNSFLEIETNAKMVILGEMKELGEYSRAEHEILYNKLAEIKNVISYFIGSNFILNKHKNKNTFNNTEEFIDYLKSHKPDKYLILLKGSRTNRLERLEDYL